MNFQTYYSIMKTKIFTLLLAVAASIGVTKSAITVRLHPQSCTDWSNVYLWAWTVEGDLFSGWPGVNTCIDTTGWYSYTFAEDITIVNIIWSNGAGSQTIDITHVTESTCYNLFSETGSKIEVKTIDCTSTQSTINGGRYKIGDLVYRLDTENQTAEVVKNNYEYSGSITIPSIVEYNAEIYTVTSIGKSAFRDCTGLTSVTIPNSVTSIGEYAFHSCTSLTAVTIPNSVTSIGGEAFRDCSSLTSVTIPNSVTSIGYSAFWNVNNIIYSGSAIGSPWGAKSVNGYVEGYLVYRDTTKTELLGCFSASTGEIIIPNSVTSIGGMAFEGCTGLTSVTIPNSVTSIGWDAFYGCSGLTSVTIGNSVTSIGYGAFWFCSGLTSVTIEAETPPILDSDVFYSTNNCPIYVPCNTLDAYKTAWSNYASQIKYAPLPYKISTHAENGNVNIASLGNYTACDTELYYKLTAVPNYGYHFTQWSDGNTDNPRTIILASDTTFTAEFAKNTYSISTTSANPEWGTTAGGKSALYLDEVEISATANYGYHFVKWNDNNTANPRTISVTEDKTYTATFAKNVYSITKNAEHGTISGNSSAEYLDFVTLTVTPDYGYHFTQWSDGLKDNPRIFQITQDTTFTAELAPDRVGTCGKDLALVWSYDPTNKVLTIGNAGSFTENMQFGLEAPNEMEELVIGNSVTAIGANAFAGIETLKKITIGESVKTIGEQAFYNCMNIETIFNYRPTPTNTYSNAFDGVDKFECVLYVLPSSIDMYKNASVWRDFYYTYAIGAEETTVTTNDVQVEPQDNAATLTWPTSNNAASYTIQITKDGVLFCTLVFNANGQLTGIAFAPSRDGQAHAPAALMTANGLQFTVTGLDSGTQYGYNLTAKDANDQTVATYSGSFTTTSEGIATGVEEVSSSLQGEDRGRLILRNGQIFILRGEKVYTLTGQEVK